ncbi:MAG: FtsW/RodA/SpoVE family cell cycle protein [Anaerolineales bacterium]
MLHSTPSPTSRIQGRLLSLAGVFLFLFSITLTLAPAVRSHSWQVDYNWQHWIGYIAWLAAIIFLHLQTNHRLPYRDPYLLPATALLSGWGLLTIFRLAPNFGYRQSAWLLVAVAVVAAGLRLPSDLGYLRRYKYLWLTGGLLLTALTFLIGTNPSGAPSPRLWLGGSGIYLQPSEPLKLLLVIYLAAYLSGGISGFTPRLLLLSARLLPLLAPTLMMTGAALLILVLQRDLGTSSIFLFLYAAIVYVASGNKRILLLSGLAFLTAAGIGYGLFDVVRLRVEAWIDPWADPSGRSYQIVQSLMAIANGGLFGRGPGLGSPGLVPIPHSDFIFVSIVEETGLLGALGLLVLLGLVTVRGLRTALRAPDSFRRFLAAGLTAYLVSQSILIIGGNLRLLPLTGVTLPFVSYGGSSLLTSFLALFFLLVISDQEQARAATFMTTPRPEPQLYLQLGAFLLIGLLAAGLGTGWWACYRAPDLLSRTDNARLTIADRYVPRGLILAQDNTPLAQNQGLPGSLTRQYPYPDLSPLVGYTHIVYGRSGLENSLDPYLRGLQGYPSLDIWWNHLLYGQPPPGLSVRLTVNIELQNAADDLLRGHRGALVILNPRNGDILAMASQPSFDSNRLDETWSELIQDPAAPLLNRATQGQYQPGTALGALLLAAFHEQGASLPPVPTSLSFPLEVGDTSLILNCALEPVERTWPGVIAAGCPGPMAALGDQIRANSPVGTEPLLDLFQWMGFYSTPAINLPAAGSTGPDSLADVQQYSAVGQSELRISPLQMALAAASLSNNGVRPAPRLVQAIQTDDASWVNQSTLADASPVFSSEAANAVALALRVNDLSVWQSVGRAQNAPGQAITWYLAGVLPDWAGPPAVLALLLEEDNPDRAIQIGQQILMVWMGR